MSAPSAVRRHRRLRAVGGRWHQVAGDGHGRPGKEAATPAIATSSSQRPPLAERFEGLVRRGQAGQWVRDGVAAENRTVVRPRDEPAGRGGIVTETDAVPGRPCPAVGGDGDP